MRVFVTGGTGLVGGAILARLLAEDIEVSAMARDLDHARSVQPRVDWIAGDLLQPSTLERVLDGCHSVFHCAGAMLPDVGNYAINRDATRALADQARRSGVARFVYLSSTAVYGDGAHSLADESTPCSGTSPYSRSKVEAEEALFDLAGECELEAWVLRPCMISGPGDRNLAPAIASLVGQELVVLPAGGREKIDIVDARDVAAAALLAGLEGRGGGVYNITGGHPRPLLEVLKSAATALGATPSWRELSLAEADRELRLARERGDAPPFPAELYAIAACERTYSTDRARRELDYTPREALCPVAEALRG